MATLYDITGRYLQLLYLPDEECTEGEQDIASLINDIQDEFEVKADNIAKVIQELTAEAKKFETEKKRLEKKQKAAEDRAKYLKQSLFQSMQAVGLQKFHTGLFNFSICKNGGKKPMTLIPGMDIPDEYCTKELDKGKIRSALEDGIELPFAKLEERGEYLKIF